MRNGSVCVAGDVSFGKHAFGMRITPPGGDCNSGSLDMSGVPMRPRHRPESMSPHAVVFQGAASSAVTLTGVDEGGAAICMELSGEAARASVDAKTTLTMATAAHSMVRIAIGVNFTGIPWDVYYGTFQQADDRAIMPNIAFKIRRYCL